MKQQWSGYCASKPKLRTYVQFKSLLEPEKYLLSNYNHEILRLFACFRCCVLPLAIDEGRHHNIDPTERICKLCPRGQVEDEYHFLLVCPLYDNLRKQYLPEDVVRDPHFHKFLTLMGEKRSTKILNLCNFVYKAFKLREESLRND